MENENLRLEDLQYKGLKIYQNKDLYCFTSDAVTLANFAKIKKGDKVCDFCSGSGIIAILLSAKNEPSEIYAVEIQNEMFELLQKNIELNNVENIKPILGDVKEFSKHIPAGSVDVVVCNPPYKKKGASFHNENHVVATARHEIKLDLLGLLESVKRVLRFGGRFYISYDANRSAELLAKLKAFELEPKRMFFAQPSPQKNATLVFVEATRGGREGVEVLSTLISNDKDGNYVQNIFDNYRRK